MADAGDTTSIPAPKQSILSELSQYEGCRTSGTMDLNTLTNNAFAQFCVAHEYKCFPHKSVIYQ